MIKTKKVLCDILKCSKHSKSGVTSCATMNEETLFGSFDGCIYYDGKAIEKRICFIEVTEPYSGLYIPENKFNFVTRFLIGFHSKFHRGITIDNKRFYTSTPHKIGDIFVTDSK